MFSRLAILVRIALANLVSSFLNLFVGGVLAFGAALLVVGGSLFATLDQALSKSIVGSITGHLQVYSARSKNALEVYGKVEGSDAVLVPLDDFKVLKARLLAVPNVARVVPMGACTTLVGSGNTIDLALERLRGLCREADAAKGGPVPAELATRLASVKAHVRTMVTVLAKDAERATEMLKGDAVDASVWAAMKTASSDEFWSTFDADPFGHLELLENKIAPEVGDADMLFIRVLGTDLAAYQQVFDRLSIIEGGPVPEGHRGILLPRLFVEDFLKLKNARRLDKIREARSVGRTIAADKELQRLVKENTAQTREVVLQLDGLGTATATQRLQEHLKTTETDLGVLFSRFLATDDGNFEVRYRFFYESLAPLLSLYRTRVGDTMTLKSYGRSGSVETAVIKVYGIFEMKGLEKSPLAGVNGLIDLVTFRELYGYLGAERKAELDAMKAATAAKEVSRETAEADLFGGDAELVADTTATAMGETPSLRRVERRSETYAPEEIDDGVVLHAALMLVDGSPRAVAETRDVVDRLLSSGRPAVTPQVLSGLEGLLASGRLPGSLAGPLGKAAAREQARAQRPGQAPDTTVDLKAADDALRKSRRTLTPADVKVAADFLAAAKPATWVVDWSSAAGFLGQFIAFFRLLLAALVVAFAFIALIVVTIGVTIATLQRTPTIGTLRAIGAQRTFVITMVLTETLVLALVFGLVGAAVGSGVVLWLHSAGIPAFRDELYFFFSGPVLRPELTGGSVVLSVLVTMAVSVLAVIFPVVLATRVSPLTAMQATE